MVYHYVIHRGNNRGIYSSWDHLQEASTPVDPKDLSIHNSLIRAIISLKPTYEELGYNTPRVYVGISDTVKYGLVHVNGINLERYSGVIIGDEQSDPNNLSYSRTCVQAVDQAISQVYIGDIDVIVAYPEVARLFNGELESYHSSVPEYRGIIDNFKANNKRRNVRVIHNNINYLSLLSMITSLSSKVDELETLLTNEL